MQNKSLQTIRRRRPDEERDGGCWPTIEQELLLKAALCRGQPAVEAWRVWKTAVDIDDIDNGSQRILPLLHRNLRANGVDDPLMNTYKGVHRRTWYENQLLFRPLTPLLSLLHDGGIRTMVLKGVPLLLHYYGEYGLRPMSDVDILVPTEQALAAVDCLKAEGWRPKDRTWRSFSTTLLRVRHSESFKNDDGHEFDLHWHLLHECCYDGADDIYWDAAGRIDVNGVSSRSLCPTDQLFHTCVHGVMWNLITPLRWMPDAALILQTAGDRIDGDRFVLLARERYLVLRVREALNYICDLLDISIPPSVLRDLEEIPVSKIERKEFLSGCRRSAMGQLPVYWSHYRSLLRRRKRAGLSSEFPSFFTYLQILWDVKNPSQVPAFVLRRTVKRGIEIVFGASK